jgi:hypothetical protein
MRSSIIITAFVATLATALPNNLARANTSVNPAAITGTTCTDPSTCVIHPIIYTQ